MQTDKYILFSFILLLIEHTTTVCDILLIELFFFSNSKDNQNLGLLIAISRTICTSLVAAFVLSHNKCEENSYQKSSNRQKVKVSSVQDKRSNCSSTRGKKHALTTHSTSRSFHFCKDLSVAQRQLLFSH